MGRRSINTTKSGKYMNPTDQARKEARKRELKKNKKQRQMVRAAVLKGKDPHQLINDMEKIDEMEYNVTAPPPLNEKVLKDKRKKLKETWERVMRLYNKEDKDRFVELKKLENDYESRRSTLVKYFESVRYAQQVQVDEIPLPATPNMPLFVTSQIPLPNELEIPMPEPLILPSILKKTSAYNRLEQYSSMLPPGVPPGPPPDLSDDDDDDDDDVDDDENEAGEEEFGNQDDPMEEEEMEKDKENKFGKPRRIRFADENSDEISSDKNMSEDEEIKDGDISDTNIDGIPNTKLPSIMETNIMNILDKGKEENGREADNETIKGSEESGEGDDMKQYESSFTNTENIPVPPIHTVPLPAGPPPGLPQGPPPGSLPIMFRPPPLRPGLPPPPRLLPPGVPPPPPGRPTLPHGPVPGLPLRLPTPSIRLPPGPPPGIPPPRLMRPPPAVPPPSAPPRIPLPPGVNVSTIPPPGQQHTILATAPTATAASAAAAAAVAVLSAPPSLMQRPKVFQPSEEEAARSATIEAKPQIRTVSADVMRFMPTTLRVKREDRHKKGSTKAGSTFDQTKELYSSTAPLANPSVSVPTKDDAYQQFLREMEELL